MPLETVALRSGLTPNSIFFVLNKYVIKIFATCIEPKLDIPYMNMTSDLFSSIDRARDTGFQMTPTIKLTVTNVVKYTTIPNEETNNQMILELGPPSSRISILAYSSRSRHLTDVQIFRTLLLNKTGSL